MKVKNYLTSVILLVFFSLTLFSQENEIHLKKEIKEKNQFRQLRDLWQKELRRTSEDINPFVLENEARLSRFEMRNTKISEDIKIGKFDESLLNSVYVANGRLKGDWFEKGSLNQSGRIHTADFDKETDIVYLGSSGGNVWKGKIDGTNWQCLNNSLQFNNIVNIRYIKENNKVRILAFAEKNTWLTDNDGLTWTKSKGLDEVNNWGRVMVGVVTAINNTVFTLTEEWNYQTSTSKFVVYKSIDKGQNFTKIKEFNEKNVRIATPKYNDNSLYLIANDKVYLLNSVDEFELVGVNDTVEEVFDENFNYTFRVVNINNTNHLAVSYYMGGKANVSYSSNGGKYWLSSNPTENFFFMNNSFDLGAANPLNMYIGGVNCSFSSDGGMNWELVNQWYDYYPNPKTKLHADIPGIHSFLDKNNKEFFLICTDGGIYTAVGTEVNNISMSGLNVSQYYSVYTGKTNIFAGSQDQGFQASIFNKEGVLDFKQIYSGDYGHVNSANDGLYVWSVYPGFSLLYVASTNELKTNNFGGNYDDRVWLPPIVAVPDSPEKAIVAAGGSQNNSRIWELTYNGQLIESKELDYVFDSDDSYNDVSALAISKINPDLYFAGTKRGNFYKSTDRGITWTQSDVFAGPDGHYLYGSAILPSELNINNVYFAGSGYNNSAMFFSNDGGKSFKAVGEGLPKCTILELAQSNDENFIFAATTLGPYVYITSTNKWYSLMSYDSPEQTYWTVEFIKGQNIARFGTYGRGIWDLKISYMNNIDSKDVDKTSQNIIIEVNPNPIINDINVNVKSNIQGNCVVKLFDIKGKYIGEIFDGYIENEIKIHKKMSEFNNHLSKGKYFITASINGFVGFKSVVID